MRDLEHLEERFMLDGEKPARGMNLNSIYSVRVEMPIPRLWGGKYEN